MRPSVRDLLGPGGVAARIVPGWEPRNAQSQMAEAMFERLTDGGALVVEAPTGVGKTLAYLVAAALSGRQVVISTNTKTLQDQIIDKDLPQLERLLAEVGLVLTRADADDIADAPISLGGTGVVEGERFSSTPIRYALMKGRSNYLCLERLRQRTGQQAFAFGTGADGDIWTELDQWSKTTQRGDRAELVALAERSPEWDEVDARSERCSGTRCAQYERCFVVRMRREAEKARLIIVNHHLLMADLALRAQAALTADGRAFGTVIPDAACLILDEAHAIEEIASAYFGGSVSNRKLERFARDVGQWAADASSSATTVAMTRATAAAESLLSSLPAQDGRVRVPAADGPAAEARHRAQFGEAHRRLPEALSAMEALAERLDIADAVTADALARRARELAESFRFVLSADDPDYVYWSERQGGGVTLGAAPVRVAHLLARFLFGRFETVAMTSATLSAGDDRCRFFLESVGAPDDCEAMVLASPFDYGRQAALYLPPDAPDPTSPAATDQLVRQAYGLIEIVGGGALFLFTSHRQMKAVHARLRDRLPYRVLVQGEGPKRELLRTFVNEAPAVLFATMSFWEGVDVPGDPLRLVLIDKLPFDAPDDPLLMARGQRLAQAGKSAFSDLQLPRAILRLKQGFGRLVRGRADRGIVALLDRRVQTKGYGRRFLAALPDATVLRSPEAVERWWLHGARSDED